MFKLICKVQNYAWGKVGPDCIVGKLYKKDYEERLKQQEYNEYCLRFGEFHEKEKYPRPPKIDEDLTEKKFAEYWMGDHPNGPCEMAIDRYDHRQYKLFYDNAFIAKNAGGKVEITELFDKEPKKFLG